MKVLTIEPVRPAWIRLHQAVRYSSFPPEELREGMACGAIRSFVLRSQYHRKLKGIRPLVILVNVESLDRFIETKEREAKEAACQEVAVS